MIVLHAHAMQYLKIFAVLICLTTIKTTATPILIYTIQIISLYLLVLDDLKQLVWPIPGCLHHSCC